MLCRRPAYLFWMTGVFVWPWVNPCRNSKAEAVLSSTTVTGSCGQMSAQSADTGQQSGEKGNQVLRASRHAEVEMGCEATMNFSLHEVQMRVSCAEVRRLHEPVRKGVRCWRGSRLHTATGIWALNFAIHPPRGRQRHRVFNHVVMCRASVQPILVLRPCNFLKPTN